jgi:hypothetical protein
MASSVTCAECDTGLRFPDAMAGKTVTRKKCGALLALADRHCDADAVSARPTAGKKGERSERGSTIRLR